MNIKKTFQNLSKGIGELITSKSYSLTVGDSLKTGNLWGDKNQYIKAYQIALYVNKAINKRSTKVGEIEFVLEKNGERVEKGDTGILDLLNKPNQYFTGRQFWALYQLHKDIYGEAYIWVDKTPSLINRGSGKVNALHLLKPDTITIKYDKTTGEVVSYAQQLAGGKSRSFLPDEIIRDWYPNPEKLLSPLPLLTAGMKEISTSVQLSEYQNNILENGGRVGDVFKIKTDRINKTGLSELKDTYLANYAEAKKAGTPLFLGGDADYVRTALTPNELDFLESKKTTLNDICILSEVPKPLLASLEDIKYDNADASMLIFMRDVVQPLMTQLASKLSNYFYPKEMMNISFVDPVPENKEEKRKDLIVADTIHALTINEKREALGLEPVKNGDDILIPFGLTTLGVEPAVIEPVAKKKAFNHPLKNKEFRIKYGDIKVAFEDEYEAILYKSIQEYTKEQMDRIVNGISPEEMRSFTKDIIDEAFNEKLEIKLAYEKFKPIMEKALIAGGAKSLALLGVSHEFVLSGIMAGWLDKKVEVFSTQINDTTFKQLKNQFSESLAAGESRQQLVRRIEGTYGDISKGRAKVIARTEIHNANQYGTFKAYGQAGLDTKIWVTVGDGKVRDTHAMVDGEEKLMDMNFSNGLMYPGDESAGAEEVINCRCQI